MTHLKLLTALTALVLLTACGGGTSEIAEDTNCTSNPFHNSCSADTAALALRITECITAGNAGETGCENLFTASASNTCLTNPFTDACTSNTDFTTYADMARTNRVRFCASDSTGSSLCTVLTTCQADPFATGCDRYFEPIRQTRIMGCIANSDNDNCASALARPNYASWFASHADAPLATAPTDRNRNPEFGVLSGLTTTQPAITGFRSGSGSYIPVTLAEFGLGGDASDGFVIWQGVRNFATSGETIGYYSGILTTTDVGAPLDNATQAGTWNGQFQVLHTSNGTLNTNFTLTVDFGTNKIRAFIRDSNNFGFFYEIEGEWDDKGVLKKDSSVEFGRDDSDGVGGGANDALESTDSRYISGKLTGLIGSDGAVGAFAGVGGTVYYAGGFVALPSAPPARCLAAGNCIANHAAYLDSFFNAPPPKTTTKAVEDAVARQNLLTPIRSHFLNVGANGIDRTDLSGTPRTLSRDGDTDDGVTYIRGSFKGATHSFVGLLPSTDLGAPLPSTTADVVWKGSYYTGLLNDNFNSNNVIYPIEFNIDFGEGTIGATDARVTFDFAFTSRGVITGFVIFGSVETAPAQGLIGEQGIVGGWANTEGGRRTDMTFGAFVAAPADLDGKATFDDWEDSFTPPPPATIDLSNAGTEVFAGFLNIAAGETTIDAGDLNTMTMTAITGGETETSSASVILPRAGSDNMDGVVYINGFNGDNSQGFVGLLPTTDLGVHFPVSDTTAMWAGSYYNSGNGGVVSSPVTFAIDFSAARTIDGSGTGTTTPVFDLTFDARGVISGTVVSAGEVPGLMGALEAEPAKVFSGTARGLIGTEGLVGGFISPTGHHGGFVADNPAFDDTPTTVGYLDWVDVTTPDTTRTAPLTNQFLTGATTVTSVPLGTFGFLTLENAETADGTDWAGDAEDGLQIYSNDHSDSEDQPTNFYTGILTTTSLGAPLTMQTAEGTWEGRLYAVRDTEAAAQGTTIINSEVANFAPTVNFGMKTISATITGVTNATGAAIVADSVTYDFTAVWDERGVFQGTINRNLSSVASAGVLTGLIGADGAVGVFINDAGAGVGYAGGFVARKAPTN